MPKTPKDRHEHGCIVRASSLDGLAVVAAVAGDANLSVQEIGGEVANTRAALFVDARATEVQRQALIAMAKALAGRVVSTIAEVTPASNRVRG